MGYSTNTIRLNLIDIKNKLSPVLNTNTF